MDEKTALESVISGNKDDYRFVVEKHQDGLLRYVYGIVLDEDVAADIAQQAFITAYIKLEQYDSRYAFATWLYRIARNDAFRWLKQVKKYVAYEEQDTTTADVSTGDAIDQAIDSRRLYDALEKLHPDQRSVVQLYYWENKTYEEIATITNRTLPTVKIWLYRAKQQLRRELS